TSETPRDRKNCLAKESYTRLKSLLTAEQLEHRHVWQREIYKLRTEADSSEQADYRCNTQCAAYMHRIQQKRASNAAFGTNGCGMFSLSCPTLDRRKGGWGVFNPVFSICCVNGKVQLPIINQPPKPLLSLLTGEDSRSCSLLPDSNLMPAFSQIYFYDAEEQLAYRQYIMPNLDFLHENSFQTLNFVIIKAHNEHQYVPPSVLEIAVLMVDDGQEIEPSN
ncbi:22796_t:CDS:2, partial [Dentiscutata erythropus]